MTTLSQRAPAKINLYLHVLARRPDGYHELDSLVGFADCGDVLTLEPADGLSLTLEGPFAAAAPAGEDNLVLRAARLLAEATGKPPRARLRLDKRLPAAAGLGGGSADAAACLRGLAALWDLEPAPGLLASLAERLGADVPVCLASRPSLVRGIGERIAPADGVPVMPALLVNPGVAVPTAAVFASLAVPPPGRAPVPPPQGRDVVQFVRALVATRNDLEAPALAVAPVIGEVLAALRAQPGCLLARMSGSGATCFGIFETAEACATAASALGARHPAWWVHAGRCGGDGP